MPFISENSDINFSLIQQPFYWKQQKLTEKVPGKDFINRMHLLRTACIHWTDLQKHWRQTTAEVKSWKHCLNSQWIMDKVLLYNSFTQQATLRSICIKLLKSLKIILLSHGVRPLMTKTQWWGKVCHCFQLVFLCPARDWKTLHVFKRVTYLL